MFYFIIIICFYVLSYSLIFISLLGKDHGQEIVVTNKPIPRKIKLESLLLTYPEKDPSRFSVCSSRTFLLWSGPHDSTILASTLVILMQDICRPCLQKAFVSHLWSHLFIYSFINLFTDLMFYCCNIIIYIHNFYFQKYIYYLLPTNFSGILQHHFWMPIRK